MRLKDKSSIDLPSDIDYEVYGLCNILNCLPDTQTFESCCGHQKQPCMIFIQTTSIGVMKRLGRVVNRNYSDGKWELLVDDMDIRHEGVVLWLRTKEVLTDYTLKESIRELINSIEYWFADTFDEYFDGKL